jgi:catechol 2,3-dioxygenase-like lactoylglutathione lyase family enzyme
MPTISFDHIHYFYSDLTAITDFYVDIMEATDLGPVELGGKQNTQLQLGGATLLFVQQGDAAVTTVLATEKLGVFHIAFLVADCDAATEYYRHKGAVVAKGPLNASANIRASFLAAPDGMWLELKQVIT